MRAMVGIAVAGSAPAPHRPVRWSRGAILRAVVAVVAVVAVAASLWLSSRPTLADALSRYGLTPSDGVQLDEETWIGVRPAGDNAVEMIMVDHDFTTGWSAGGGKSAGAVDDALRTGMIGAGGQDMLGWSTFLYGIGPAETSDIVVAGSRAIGFVTDQSTGAFVVVSREELAPDDLHYFLLDAHGDILFDGTGLAATQNP
jgi:hypothetical protein